CDVWNYAMRDGLQSDDLRMILRRERTLCLCRTQQAMVLLESMGFQHSFRHKSARDRGATDYDPFFRGACFDPAIAPCGHSFDRRRVGAAAVAVRASEWSGCPAKPLERSLAGRTGPRRYPGSNPRQPRS